MQEGAVSEMVEVLDKKTLLEVLILSRRMPHRISNKPRKSIEIYDNLVETIKDLHSIKEP